MRLGKQPKSWEETPKEGSDCEEGAIAHPMQTEKPDTLSTCRADWDQTVGVETVLSTPKYRRLVDKAKQLGFEVRLIYVLLDSPQRNIERVRLRVKKGGHAVPENKILERHARSLEQLPWFLDQADLADAVLAGPRSLDIRMPPPSRMRGPLAGFTGDLIAAPTTGGSPIKSTFSARAVGSLCQYDR